MALEWKYIDDSGFVMRARVPGGWLVKVSDEVTGHDGSTPVAVAVALTFLPDPDHTWKP